MVFKACLLAVLLATVAVAIGKSRLYSYIKYILKYYGYFAMHSKRFLPFLDVRKKSQFSSFIHLMFVYQQCRCNFLEYQTGFSAVFTSARM